jgi:anti-sigma factor RsiW
MTCADLDILLCDYVDGTLNQADRSRVESHLQTCAACAELARDAAAGFAFIERAEAVQPPRELMTRISFAIAGELHHKTAPRWRRALGRWFEPILQPRFAMGMAMTILSFSMMGRFVDIPVRQLTPADLAPRNVWMAIEDRVHRVWDRGVKYYESMRLFVELQSRLSEITEEDERRKAAAEDSAAPQTNAPARAETPPGEREGRQK